MIILGISAFFHDSSACILKDGKLIAAAEEERFTRKKHDASFPINAIKYCLKEAGVSGKELDAVAFYEKPLVKFERVMSQFVDSFPRGLFAFNKTMPSWINEKLRIRGIIKKKVGFDGEVYFVEHHLAHAASSYLMSPFKDAVLLTVDGVGEWASATAGYAKDNKLVLEKEIRFPHSLGLLYSTFTVFLGFTANSGEYKAMGLSAYGKPKYVDKVRKLIEVKEDGSFMLNMEYFVYHYKMAMPSKKFIQEFGPSRKKSEAMTEYYQDIASSVQKLTEEILFKILNALHKKYKSKNLCMAGGVALNSLANGKILKKTPFKSLFIQPAAGDGGTSVGAAAFVYFSLFKNKRNVVMEHSYLGPGYDQKEIKEYLDKNRIKYNEFRSGKELVETVGKLIYENNVVGWFQGRMEFGPRALGARSILSNPCNPKMQEILNLKVKHRECYDDQTQILTKEGWKSFKELTKDDKVATLNPKTKELVYQRIEKRMEYNYTGKMVYFKNKRINLVVTPEHNMWAKKITNHRDSIYVNRFGFEEAKRLVCKENIQIKAIEKWNGKEKKYFLIPKIVRKKYGHIIEKDKIPMDLWLEFFGYYLSEGCCCYDQGKHNIYISQNVSSKYYRRMKGCLNKIYQWRYNSGSFIKGNKQLFEYLKQFGKAKSKFIPREFLELSERQLKILFDALMRGDGTPRKKQYKYTTTSKRLADEVQELGLKLGYSITTSTEVPKNPKHNITYYVRLNKGSKISYVRKNQSGLIDYNGKVYCVKVPKYNLLCVKRDEKIVFSGNSFRPFAPVVCVEDAPKYFECDDPIPLAADFMLLVYPIRKEKQKLLPAVTHVDGTGRLQTIRKEQNPRYYEVIKEFGKLSGVPVLINTSFNIRGEPIVCKPEEAYRCMMGTGIDCLVMDRFLIRRADNAQDMWDSEAFADD